MSKDSVSVAVITYNQEAYIEKAVNSVLDQQTSFDFEIVIGDDGSTDHTSAICKKIQRKHPNKIKYIQNEKNLGYVKNLLNVFRNCCGTYIAILEADDFWVNPDKLSKQVEIVKNNPEISLCFTNSLIDDFQKPDKKQYFYRQGDIVFSLADCLKNCVAPTSTFLFKRELFNPPFWFERLIFYEYYLIYLLAEKGRIYYLNEITSCRTQHYRGLSMKLKGDRIFLSELINNNHLMETYCKETKKLVRNIVLGNQINITSALLSNKKLGLTQKMMPHIHISKTKPDWKGIKVFLSYLKLQAKYYLVKFKLYKTGPA